MNNKAQTNPRAIFAFLIVFGILFTSIISYGLFAFFTNQVDSAFTGTEIIVGNVNFTESAENTWGSLNDAVLSSLNIFALMTIFGTFLGILAVAFFTRGRNPVLFFILDVFIIFLGYIIAGYASDTYETLIGVSALNEIFVENMALGSSLMLNLPILVVVFGALTMIISYISIPETKEEQVAGY